jgi:hypothetical protein
MNLDMETSIRKFTIQLGFFSCNFSIYVWMKSGIHSQHFSPQFLCFWKFGNIFHNFNKFTLRKKNQIFVTMSKKKLLNWWIYVNDNPSYSTFHVVHCHDWYLCMKVVCLFCIFSLSCWDLPNYSPSCHVRWYYWKAFNE